MTFSVISYIVLLWEQFVVPANGVWLSLVERYVRDVEAAGSNPVTPISQGCGNDETSLAGAPKVLGNRGLRFFLFWSGIVNPLVFV